MTSRKHPLESGLFVTSIPLPGYEEEVPADRLVYLDTQTLRGQAAIRLPDHIDDNRWVFDEHSFPILDADYHKTLKSRPTEGFYILQQGLHLNPETVIPSRALLQLSYSLGGTPILHIGRFEGTSIHFPKVGYKFSEDVLDLLKGAGFHMPPPPSEARQLH